MTLYSCKEVGDRYRVTKFDADMNVESSYLCERNACECPAAQRNTCRHRQMIPRFIARDATRGQFFLDFDRGVWIRASTEAAFAESANVEGGELSLADLVSIPGVTVIGLGDPKLLYDTIADAVGEPRSAEPSPGAAKPKPFDRRM